MRNTSNYHHFSILRNGSNHLEAAHVLTSGKRLNIIPLEERFNVDFPIPSLKVPIGVGLTFVQLSPNICLDLELSAMENQGDGQVISSPRVITENQKPVIIEAGTEIPYQIKTTQTTHINFKKAALSLYMVYRVGYIYEHTQNQQVHRRPFLGTLPIIASFFSHRATTERTNDFYDPPYFMK